MKRRQFVCAILSKNKTRTIIYIMLLMRCKKRVSD